MHVFIQRLSWHITCENNVTILVYSIVYYTMQYLSEIFLLVMVLNNITYIPTTTHTHDYIYIIINNFYYTYCKNNTIYLLYYIGECVDRLINILCACTCITWWPMGQIIKCRQHEVKREGKEREGRERERVEREKVEKERKEVVWYVYLFTGTCLVRYKCCSHILASVLFILSRSPLLFLYNYMFLLSVVCHIILIAINSRRNIYTCFYFSQVNFAQDYSKSAKNNRLNTFVLLAINMKYYYRPISDCYACAHAINCTFIFKCVTYDHTSKIGYLMEGIFDVVHLYILKILCYDTHNLSTQYPSCSLFISSFVYYTIDFQVTCVYYREGNLGKGGRVNNLFFHQPIT